MRVLFVSGVANGGAPKSTLELAQLLVQRGHDVAVLLTERPGDNSLFGIVNRATIKLSRFPVLASSATWLVRRLGRRVVSASGASGARVLMGTVAENAAPELVQRFQPDVVVANSLPRVGFERLATSLEGIVPLVLYMREKHSLTHLTISGLQPAGIIGNAREFCDEVAAMGLDATFVPSIVDVEAAATTTTRQAVLMINPIAENRPELFVFLAAARPDAHFVLQESWPLDPTELADLAAAAQGLGNLEIRRKRIAPADIYRDAMLLVATYPAGRPRVVVEAQYNGIPVVALDQPAMVEAVGPLDAVVPAGAENEAWLEAISRYLDDPDFYESASASAAEWARRAEIAPETIVARFEEALNAVLAGARA